jgi:hypothetical protein
MGRKAVLYLHVVTSAGLIGAVALFLVFATAGLGAADVQEARAAYWGAGIAARLIILPLALIGVLSGIVVAVVSRWGLLRHHWVAAKLWLSLFTVAVLVLHLGPVVAMADLSWHHDLMPDDAIPARRQLVIASAGGMVVLLGIAVLSVFKPKGMTRRGWRFARETKGQVETGAC